MVRKALLGGALSALALAALTGCADKVSSEEGSTQSLLQASNNSLEDQIKDGKKLFEKKFHGADNKRACATCHIESDHLALKPATVQQLHKNDPLFDVLDADNPTAPKKDLTFNHLKRGLVRVTLELDEKVDLIAVPPSNPNPQQSLEAAAAFSDGFAQFWWDNLVVKGTHLCPDFRTPGEPTVNVAAGQQYEIVTPCDRKISVWRGVPTIENTAYTAPYLFDSRATTLEEQAQGALEAHAAFVGEAAPSDLSLIATFEKSIFSGGPNGRGAYVNSIVGPCMTGTPTQQRACLSALPDPEVVMPPTAGMDADQLASWQRGKVLYDQTCAACHGTPTDNRIINRPVHDGFFPKVGLDGNVVFEPPFPGAPFLAPASVVSTHMDDEHINIATPFIRYVSMLFAGILPPGAPNPITAFAADVDFPKYRMRFYADASRTTPVADMPPLPVVVGADPQNPITAIFPAADPDPVRAAMGGLKTGPNFANQLYTPDPGRAIISGDYADFEAFDVPQLRGIAHTAPYFHDNQSATLADVVTFYSQNVFPFIAGNIGLPVQNPPVPGVDTLTPAEKADLVHFLDVF